MISLRDEPSPSAQTSNCRARPRHSIQHGRDSDFDTVRFGQCELSQLFNNARDQLCQLLSADRRIIQDLLNLDWLEMVWQTDIGDNREAQDLHATLLHLLGFDHEQLTYRVQGRDFRLTDVHGQVVTEVLR